MIAPTFVMIGSILSLRQCYQSNLLSLGFADGSAFRFWKFVFCYVFDKGFWNNWIVFSISCYCLKAVISLELIRRNREIFFSRVSDLAEQRI